MTVYDLSARQPHTVVEVDGAVHVLPTQTIRDVANGRLPLDALPEPVIRTLLTDWLRTSEQ